MQSSVHLSVFRFDKNYGFHAITEEVVDSRKFKIHNDRLFMWHWRCHFGESQGLRLDLRAFSGSMLLKVFPWRISGAEGTQKWHTTEAGTDLQGLTQAQEACLFLPAPESPMALITLSQISRPRNNATFLRCRLLPVWEAQTKPVLGERGLPQSKCRAKAKLWRPKCSNLV